MVPERQRGLVVDYGGVLTSPVTHSWRAFCDAEGIEREMLRAVFLDAYSGNERSPVHLVETGQSSAEEFEAGLAAELSARAGRVIDAERLLERVFAQVVPDEAMFEAVAVARSFGVRTALLSNSFGQDSYPYDRFEGLFDVVVISAQVGLRKPDPAIYRLTADRLELDPGACVFVDDLDTNVEAAQAAGMTGVLHRGAARTVPRLADLLDLDLPSVSDGGT